MSKQVALETLADRSSTNRASDSREPRVKRGSHATSGDDAREEEEANNGPPLPRSLGTPSSAGVVTLIVKSMTQEETWKATVPGGPSSCCG